MPRKEEPGLTPAQEEALFGLMDGPAKAVAEGYENASGRFNARAIRALADRGFVSARPPFGAGRSPQGRQVFVTTAGADHAELLLREEAP